MFMADDLGILSDVIYGPDQRSKIDDNTSAAVMAVYAPTGIGQEAVAAHLEDMMAYLRLFSPEARQVLAETYPA